MIIQIFFKKNALIFCSIVILCCSSEIYGNPDAKRLYDDLLSNYNKLVRPVMNVTNALSVKIKLKLSQLIDVNLKNQIMTTNVWIEQSWYDYKLKWNPEDYGSVDMLFVPSDNIWRPDIVLYNNADGNFEVTLATKATLHYTGKVEWNPPAIYKSSCEIDVEYFPFDEQTCVMKFGSWTYDGFQVDLRHKDETKGSSIVDLGIDLKDFYTSVEWDILEVPAIRGEKFYTCCEEPYLDITFNITMRRKTLFYTVNLIIPCMGIAFLTILVFYLPSDSGEKVSLSISILLSLTVFFLLLAEIIPPTSLVVPLLGKFVLFTMILDTLSICVTVIVLNVHFRCPQTHIMNPWVKRVFIHVLPRLLVMKRPQYMLDRSRFHSHQSMWIQSGNNDQYYYNSGLELESQEMLSSNYREAEETRLLSCRIHGTTSPIIRMSLNNVDGDYEAIIDPFLSALAWHQCPEVHKAMDGVRFIACHIKREEDSIRVKEDWKYVAMVLDRLFLWIFTTAVVVGTAGIILQAPTLYDDREPIDRKISEIATRVKSYSASRVLI